jgi:hypothetical protein
LKTLPGASTLYLQGTLSLHKDEVGKKLVNYPLKVAIPEPPPKTKATPTKDPNKTKMEEMTEQLRDVQINWIPKLDAEDSKKLYEKLLEAYDSHLPLHIARLQFLDSGSSSSGDAANTSGSEVSIPSPKSDVDSSSTSISSVKRAKTPELCREMVSIADKVLGMVDQPALLAFIGNRSSAQMDIGKTKLVMDKQRTAVIEALVKNGIAMTELLKINEGITSTQNLVTIHDLDNILFDLQKYLDVTDARVIN